MVKEYWLKATRPISEYPIGTKFKAIMGGHWIKTERGYKWCTGATFPNVGGDWDGTVLLPNNPKYDKDRVDELLGYYPTYDLNSKDRINTLLINSCINELKEIVLESNHDEELVAKIKNVITNFEI